MLGAPLVFKSECLYHLEKYALVACFTVYLALNKILCIINNVVPVQRYSVYILAYFSMIIFSSLTPVEQPRLFFFILPKKL